MDEVRECKTYELHEVPPINSVVEIIDDVEIDHGYIGAFPVVGDYVISTKWNTRFIIYEICHLTHGEIIKKKGDTICMVRRV